MNHDTYANGRGETAHFDGLRAWSGDDSDETSRALHALQPLATVFPPCAPSDADVRLAQVACDCLAGRAPSIVPEDDERDAFRGIWDAAAAMRDEFDRVDVVPLAFSAELGVFARDVVVAYKLDRAYVAVFQGDGAAPSAVVDGTPFCVFTDPTDALTARACNPAAYLAGMQMAVLAAGRQVSASLGNPIAVTPSGRRLGLADRTCDAALMLALRTRTEWCRAWQESLPF